MHRAQSRALLSKRKDSWWGEQEKYSSWKSETTVHSRFSFPETTDIGTSDMSKWQQGFHEFLLFLKIDACTGRGCTRNLKDNSGHHLCRNWKRQELLPGMPAWSFTSHGYLPKPIKWFSKEISQHPYTDAVRRASNALLLRSGHWPQKIFMEQMKSVNTHYIMKQSYYYMGRQQSTNEITLKRNSDRKRRFSMRWQNSGKT